MERSWVPPSFNGGSYTFDFDELKEELKAGVIGTNSVESKKNSGDNKQEETSYQINAERLYPNINGCEETCNYISSHTNIDSG